MWTTNRKSTVKQHCKILQYGIEIHLIWYGIGWYGTGTAVV